MDSDAAPFEATPPGSRDLGVGPAKVAAIDAEHLRNAVAARLFGAAAEPVKIGRFTIIERLGAGGMGVVYSAYDNELDRRIAVKLLRRIDQGGAHLARLTREAQALAKLSHPNVVQVFELGNFRGQTFVAMEFIDGHTLREWAPAKDEDALTATLAVFAQAGRGLAAAHEAGLIHRDFKPDNVLVGKDGRVRVVDFGLARGDSEPAQSDSESTQGDSEFTRGDSEAGAALSGSHANPPTQLRSQSQPTTASMGSSTDSFNAPLTRTGDILGTPAYMAPEQHRGQGVDARTDQFAFCVALWEKLHGERPFHGRNLRELARAVVEGELDPNPGGNVPAHIRRALERGLSVAPAARWPSMDHLLAALTCDPRRRRRGIASAVLAGALALSVGSALLIREQGPGPCDGGERELEGIWDDAIKDQVQRAFRATAAPYAEEAWTGTARHLDRFADEWVTSHKRVCEASMVRGQEDPEAIGRKMVCLGQRLTELEQLTRLLADADIDITARAVVASSSLQPISECADASVLVERSDEDPRQRELDRMLLSASGRKALDKYDEGLAIAREALELAREIGDARGEAQAQLLLGQFLARRHILDEAAAALRASLRRADVAGDDRTRVRALTQLMWVAYLQADVDAGEAATADARAALGRLRGVPLLEADFHHYSGSLALARDDDEAATRDFARSLEIRQAELGDDHPEVAISMSNIAHALSRSGRWEQAEAQARGALAIFEATLGADHPYAASSHNNIGNSLSERGRHLAWKDPEAGRALFVEAAEHYAKAVQIREANFGTTRPGIAFNLHNLGEMQRRLGASKQARETFERSLAIKLEHLDADHPSVAMTRTGLGRSLLALAQIEQARAELEKAAANRQKRKSSSDGVGETFFALAQALEAGSNGDPAQLAKASELAEQAREAYEDAGLDYRGELEDVVEWIAQRAAPK